MITFFYFVNFILHTLSSWFWLVVSFAIFRRRSGLLTLFGTFLLQINIKLIIKDRLAR